MNRFTIHTGIVVPLDRCDVDTDQIIPKQFLKRIERSGFGQFVFYDWRYSPAGERNGAFVLNEPRYETASILVAGKNFGCGSSREHAVWALQDYGFRVVIAPSFADIFANNCFKVGLLPVVLDDEEVNAIGRRARAQPGYKLTVDLEKKIVRDSHGFRANFPINDFQRYCLMEGLDDIGLTLRYESEISKFEKQRATSFARTPLHHPAPT